MKITHSLLLITIGIFGIAAGLFAAPSGGPYGPRYLNYEIPTDATQLVFVSVDGDPESEGVSVDTPTTIEQAIKQAKTGTVIVLKAGTYRTGDLVFNQGITLQPYKDDEVILKGTLIAENWESHRDGFWRTKWETLFPAEPQGWWRREREGMRTPPWFFNNDMVFKNGKLLEARGGEGDLDENSYTIDYKNGYVYVNFDPSDELMEITAWDVCLLRTMEPVNGMENDHKGPIIRGITMTQYAYRAVEIEGNEPQSMMEPGTYGNDIVESTFEDVTISFCSRVAGYFRGNNMRFQNCLIADTGTEGIYIIGSADTVLNRNIITRTNIEPISGYFASAVKIFNQSDRVIVDDNLVIDNLESSGVWWDVGNDDAVFINNWVENTQNGFFFEISQKATCAGNVFVNCPKGAWALNSRDVKFHHNTFVNSQLSIQRTERSAANDHFGWHPSTGPDVDERFNHVVTNNLMVATPDFKDPLLWVFQVPGLCGKLTNSQIKEMHSNVFAREQGGNDAPIIHLSPTTSDEENCGKDYDSIEELAVDLPEFAAESESWEHYKGRILKNIKLHNLSIQGDFPGNPARNTTPDSIRKLFQIPENAAVKSGAFLNGNM